MKDHPVMEERDEAADELGLMLQQGVREQLGDGCEFDARYVALDRLKAPSIKCDGESRVEIVGAFYLLDGNRDRMLPVAARLNLKPDTESTVKLAGRDSAFAMPPSERQFMRRNGERPVGAPPEPALGVGERAVIEAHAKADRRGAGYRVSREAAAAARVDRPP